MKMTISLASIPLSVCIEGSDEEMEHMVDVAVETMIQMKKIWRNSLMKQTKIDERRDKSGKRNKERKSKVDNRSR